MAGFKKSGIDLDSLLEPIGSFTKRTNVNYTINGVDISNIYCNAADGAAYGTTGFLANNVDIGTLFAAVGTTTVAGQLWIWGGNWSGQLGNNSSTNGSPNAGVSSPIQTVAGGSNWKTISASSRDTSNTFRSAGIKTDGTLWLWGEGVTSPAQGKGTDTNWKEVSPGICSAAVKTDGTLWLWGNNQYGNLGTNDTTNRSSPVQTISAGTNWKQVSSIASNNTGAIKTDGTLWMWGANNEYVGAGAIGDNTTTNRSSPVQTIAAGSTWKVISVGNTFAMAIK
jgi:alpha-tubulin suppressor-like RCC1 family protein